MSPGEPMDKSHLSGAGCSPSASTAVPQDAAPSPRPLNPQAPPFIPQSQSDATQSFYTQAFPYVMGHRTHDTFSRLGPQRRPSRSTSMPLEGRRYVDNDRDGARYHPPELFSSHARSGTMRPPHSQSQAPSVPQMDGSANANPDSNDAQAALPAPHQTSQSLS